MVYSPGDGAGAGTVGAGAAPDGVAAGVAFL